MASKQKRPAGNGYSDERYTTIPKIIIFGIVITEIHATYHNRAARPLKNVEISILKESEAQNCVLSDFFWYGKVFVPLISHPFSL